ncbi:MAG: hypothetical protein CMF19_04000 [Idiomarinaceae bacterium]|nr:hypothetical protein [Idiomarinaceae bacterium]
MAAVVPFIPKIIMAVSAGLTYKGGRETAKAMAQQAALARQQARQQYLQAREEGIAVLDDLLRNASTLNARAGAGSIEASSGSADTIANFNLGAGVNDMIAAQEGGQFALRAGELQSQNLMSQAKATNLQAFAQALGYIGQAAAMKTPGTPPSTGPTPGSASSPQVP